MIGVGVLFMAVGGTIPVYLISKFLDWALFKRVMEMREIAIICSGVFAAAISVVLYGFGHADGGRWNPGWGTIAYFFSGVFVLTLRLRAYARKEERRNAADPSLVETFE